jgi:hypothetical protein
MMSDPIVLLIELRIRPDKFDDDLRVALIEEVEASGFPANEENIAWYSAEQVANEATFGYGACTAEVMA